MSNLTQKTLKENLKYDPEKGLFTWLKKNGAAAAGYNAGCLNTNGYWYIRLRGRLYQRSRLAWFYTYGYFPENCIDHKNRDRTDDRIKNLRDSSYQCNNRNRGNSKNNKSGVKGVSWDSREKKWVSQIMSNRVGKNLGYYKDIDNAVCARLAAEQCMDWEGCDDSSPAFKYVKKLQAKAKGRKK